MCHEGKTPKVNPSQCLWGDVMPLQSWAVLSETIILHANTFHLIWEAQLTVSLQMFKTPAMLIEGVIVIVYNSVRSHFTDLTHKLRSVPPTDTQNSTCTLSHTHSHTSLLQSWIMGCRFEASCFKVQHITARLNLRDDGALMESGAACSCLQSALDDYEAAFVFAVLFFLIISIHVVLYIFYIYCLRNATERNCRRHRTFTSHQEFLVCDVLYVQNVHVVTSFWSSEEKFSHRSVLLPWQFGFSPPCLEFRWL